EEPSSAELYFRNFGATDAFRNVWNAAAAGRDNTPEEFDAARGAFWRAVTRAKTSDAQTIKQVLSDAGFVFNEKKPTNAPLLRISGWDPPEGDRESFSRGSEGRWDSVLKLQALRGWSDDETRRYYESAFSEKELREYYELKEAHPDWSEKDLEANMGTMYREIAARSLSIDHINPKSSFPDQTLRPENLRFMMRDDNSARGNRFDAEDEFLGASKPPPPPSGPPSDGPSPP